MKKLFFICAILCLSWQAIASNTISLSSVSGTPQTEVEVVVSLENSDAISALEITIPLGEHLQYVNGSAVLASTRSNGHQISAAQVAQDMRIYVYSLNLSTLQGNTGELLRFRLLLGNEPADYALTPNVVLSNAQGTSLEASVQSGQATILAPKLQILTEQIDYGHIPIRATYTKSLQLKNVGTLPLEITNIAIDDALITPAQTALTISPASTTNVTLTYAPVERGAITRELIVTSNAVNGEQVATIVADPFSVNELHVGSASGIADSIVTISLTMNNMEPIVAMQCAFKLPKQLEYVANSMTLNTERQNGHQTLSVLRGDTLVLALFSMSNQALYANDGEIATFQLRLNGSSGTYYLKPIDVVLSNIAEENMLSATSQGKVTIKAPSISGNASLSFGNIPVTEQATATYSIRNNGSAPLTIERATFLAEGYSVVEELPLTIANSKSATITVAYQPSAEGDFSTTMNLYTNDPNNRLKTVALSGHMYEPNALTLSGQNNQEGTYTLSVALDNYTDIVAVQYDLHWRNDMTTSQSAFVPSARMQNHNAVVTPLDEDSYRIIIYSMSNATIAGHDGELHQLVFTPQGEANYCGSIISIDNIVLSNAAGGDKTSAKSIALRAAQTQWANDTATACDQYVWNGKTYTQSGTYIDTIPSIAGCDSIVTLHLTINHTQYAEEIVTACDSYTWTDGKTYTKSGTYYQYLQTIHGCDSTVVLHLTINNSVAIPYEVTACDSYTWSNGITYTQSGVYYDSLKTIHGCDSVEILTLTINYSDTAYFSATACDSYAWHDKTYSTSGTYEYLTQTIHGCDSLEVLTLTINRSITTEQTEVACDSYTWTDGKTYTKSGTYYQYLQTVLGCDSTVVLHLTINNSVAIPYEVTACDSYTWSNGITYTQSGVYYDSLKTIHGCDSVEILTLTINYSDTAYLSATACDSYTWHDETYTTSGTYEYLTHTVNRCDSLEVLTLTINNTVYTEETITACDSYTWNGETYAESGEYTYTTTAANGCDSIVTLHLTINNTQYTEETVTACDSYTWNGETYTASGEYTYTTTATNGCDSIVTLHLTINNTQYAEETVTACDAYTWNGETYTTSGDYIYATVAANGCDSIVTLHLTINDSEIGETEFATICYGETFTWNGQTYSTEGEYSITLTNALGCDSVATLQLTIMPEAVTTTETVVVGSDELPYTWRGNTYSATGQYTDVEQYVHVACDSIIHILDLTVLTTGNHDEQSVTICETEAPYTWYGESYSVTGKYTYAEKYVGTDIDSIQHILNLTVNPTVYTEEHITACDSYEWNGQTYATTGAYTYTTVAANGCDSIVTLYLTINNSEVGETEYATICYGETFTWNGQTYSTEGEYNVVLTNALGCDSTATLHLTIMPEATTKTETVVVGSDELPYTWRGNTYSATGQYTDVEQYATVACDSAIYVLDLTVLTTGNHDEQSVTICETEAPYTWYGESYSATGKYTYTEKYAGTDIDSIQHILNLTVNPTVYTEEHVTACDSYTWNGETYTVSGDYTYTTTAATGCDSIVTLHLTINKSEHVEFSMTACDAYEWHGMTYTVSGDYTYTTTTDQGCERVEVLHLTINKSEHVEFSMTACDAYEWHGLTYTQSGDYTYTTTTAAGCERVEILHLTINKSEHVEFTETACDEYVWNGVTYTESGDYIYTTTTDQGCERVEVLHLTINKSEHVEFTETACDSYVWNGITYTESGDYTYTTTTNAGCERVEVLHLTINKSEHVEFTKIACDSYVWNGVTYTESGDYTYTTTTAAGCERVEVLHLTINKSEHVEFTETACDSYVWNGVTYTESGDYTYTTTTAAGCERVEVLHLTILPEAVTESEELALCPSELPYEWYGQSLIEAGTYSATEPYVGMECDSVIHELTLNVYVQTLPAAVTLPIVRTGEVIDVTIPTAEIQAHIAAETWYAPNAEVAWYIMENSDWAALSAEPVAAGITEVTLKYAVETDCGNIASDNMVIDVIPTSVENINSQSPISNYQKVLYEDHIYILRDGKMYTIMGQEL